MISHQEIVTKILHLDIIGDRRKVNFIHHPLGILMVVGICGLFYPTHTFGSCSHIPVILLWGTFFPTTKGPGISGVTQKLGSANQHIASPVPLLSLELSL